MNDHISRTSRRRSTPTLVPSPCGGLFETDASNPLGQDELSGSTGMSWTGSCMRARVMNNPLIGYRSTEGATLESELNVLAAI